MTEEQTPAMNQDIDSTVPNVDDVFNVPVDAVDTSMPILKERLYSVLIAKAEKVASKATPGNENLKLTLKTCEEATTTTGETIPEGWPLFTHIPITVTPDYPASRVSKNIAAVCKSCGVLGVTVGQVIANPSMLEGAIGVVKVKISKETPEYPAGNQVGAWMEVK